MLRPGGWLVDLRPAAAHRRIGLGEGRAWRLAGVMRESLDQDLRADRAVALVVRRGLFDPAWRSHVLLERVMDGMDDFHAWISEFGERRMLPEHGWLTRRLERGLARRRVKIVARGPLTMGGLRKIEQE